ncbi:hypothetical protein C8R46DRAFT_1024279 [Mycena filopes]|nr:hypothetical protein C8R46DRAFT_1024279 [Mycena filopes]
MYVCWGFNYPTIHVKPRKMSGGQGFVRCPAPSVGCAAVDFFTICSHSKCVEGIAWCALLPGQTGSGEYLKGSVGRCAPQMYWPPGGRECMCAPGVRFHGPPVGDGFYSGIYKFKIAEGKGIWRTPCTTSDISFIHLLKAALLSLSRGPHTSVMCIRMLGGFAPGDNHDNIGFFFLAIRFQAPSCVQERLSIRPSFSGMKPPFFPEAGLPTGGGKIMGSPGPRSEGLQTPSTHLHPFP